MLFLGKFLQIAIFNLAGLFQDHLILELWDHFFKKSWQFVDGLEDFEGLWVANAVWEVDVFVQKSQAFEE